MNKKNYINLAKRSANIQIKELKKINKVFNNSFVKAVDLILNCKGKVVLGGIGKSGLVARKLLTHPMMAIASDAYLTEYGTPQHPQDLKNHSCIISNNDQWQFENADYKENIKVTGRWKSNNAQVVVNACEQGLGIAYLPQHNFLSSIKAGKLTPVLNQYWRKDAQSWIVYQDRRFLPMKARLAIDYLLAHFSK